VVLVGHYDLLNIDAGQDFGLNRLRVIKFTVKGSVHLTVG
jgi:hypothetical protein